MGDLTACVCVYMYISVCMNVHYTSIACVKSRRSHYFHFTSSCIFLSPSRPFSLPPTPSLPPPSSSSSSLWPLVRAKIHVANMSTLFISNHSLALSFCLHLRWPPFTILTGVHRSVNPLPLTAGLSHSWQCFIYSSLCTRWAMSEEKKHSRDGMYCVSFHFVPHDSCFSANSLVFTFLSVSPCFCVPFLSLYFTVCLCLSSYQLLLSLCYPAALVPSFFFLLEDFPSSSANSIWCVLYFFPSRSSSLSVSQLSFTCTCLSLSLSTLC